MVSEVDVFVITARWWRGSSTGTGTGPGSRGGTCPLSSGPSSFGIFDVFPDDAGRDAHLSGAVAAALGEQTGKLFSEPTIEKLDVLGSKLPA